VFEEKNKQIEKEVMNFKCHQASTLSCLRILVALHYGFLKKEDRFVLSKAHASSALYFIKADLGFFDKSEIKDFDTHYQFGSLGMGLGVACGMALAKKELVVCLVGDGELYEGSSWEAIQFASGQRLNNLICIVDRNGMSGSDFTESFSPLEPLEDKFNSFGWQSVRIDGNNQLWLLDLLVSRRLNRGSKPLCIIANTIKGKGYPEFEGNPLCHKMTI
jgi:transketolase